MPFTSSFSRSRPAVAPLSGDHDLAAYQHAKRVAERALERSGRMTRHGRPSRRAAELHGPATLAQKVAIAQLVAQLALPLEHVGAFYSRAQARDLICRLRAQARGAA